VIANLPRGVRNNNPGNIEYDPRVRWDGLVGIEPVPLDGSRQRFARFATPEHGIRAIVKILSSYRRRGLDTVPKIVETWAPACDNNPVSQYVDDVDAIAHVRNDTVLPLELPAALVAALVRAIIKFECAGFEYPDDVLASGVAMGLGQIQEA
jgi:hypothetical protein